MRPFWRRLIVTTSFGLQLRHAPFGFQQLDQIPVVFVDTGYLFPETYEYAQAKKLDFKEKVYSAMTSQPTKRPATGSSGTGKEG